MVTTHTSDATARARAVAETVVDPELPMLTLADLGVLRTVEMNQSGAVIVSVTPTYSGCPALHEMRVDLRRQLQEVGFPDVEVRTVLNPPWTSDWITETGRRKLSEYGIAPPDHLPQGSGEAVSLPLLAPRKRVDCPRCGSSNTDEVSEFGATACKALHKCRNCLEPFEYFKEI